MKELLLLSLLGVLVGLPIYLLYWNLFRPVLIQRLKYRLYECRDELRLNFINGGIGDSKRAYSLLELFCNKAIARIDHVDLIVLFGKVDKRVEMEAERDISTIFEADAPLRHCFIQITIAAFGAACANSPGVLILIAPIVIFAVTVLWFNKAKSWAIGLMRRAFGSFYLKPC